MSLHPEHANGVSDNALHGLEALLEVQASGSAHIVTGGILVNGRRFCECSCGGTVELSVGVRPFCRAGSIDQDLADTLTDLRHLLTRALAERERRLVTARRDAARDHERLYRLLRIVRAPGRGRSDRR
jgi:hypothetical protein